MDDIANIENNENNSVFGGTHPQLDGPYSPNPNNKIIQIENLNCRPCHRYGKSKCPKKSLNQCMKDIDVSLSIDVFNLKVCLQVHFCS